MTTADARSRSSDDGDLEKKAVSFAPDGDSAGKDKLSKEAAAVAVLQDAQIYGVQAAYSAKCQLVNEQIMALGMGRYQWELFAVAGFGWLADNLWLQVIAIVLPQINAEFDPPHVQFATLALYAGLIVGCLSFGLGSDLIGRKRIFNITLFFAGTFGLCLGAAPSFIGFCCLTACMGLGLGGNLPVDGALFLEFLPADKQWLLTFLSLFWSVGQVVGSLISWPFIANYSCPQDALGRVECPRAINMGWRYSLFTCGAFTLALFALRAFVFPIAESPKFLIAQGRDAEAIASLERVGRKNGKEISLTLEQLQEAGREFGWEPEQVREELAPSVWATAKRNLQTVDLSHVKPLFANKRLACNTGLILAIWGLLGLAFPLFNGFLALYLSDFDIAADNSISNTYRNYTIQAVCGVPGSFLAAWLVDLRGRFLGRRGAMALSTILTAIFLFLFTTARTSQALLGYNCVIALTQNAMYGTLYAYTPEAFPGPHRGTGDALASGANRILGLVAPLIAAYGGSSTRSAPVYVSAALFLVAGILMILLPLETAGRAAM